MSLTKQFLIFLLRLLESHKPNQTEQERNQTFQDTLKFFKTHPKDEDYHFVIENHEEAEQTITNRLHGYLIHAELFLESSTRLRMSDYECTHDELDNICTAFYAKRQYALVNYPIEINPNIEDTPIYFVRFMLDAVRENLQSQGVSFGVAKCYIQASNPDDAIALTRERIDEMSQFWALESTDMIRKITINTCDDEDNDLDDMVRCIEENVVVVRIEVGMVN